MFDAFYGEINGQNIYDHDYINDEFSEPSGSGPYRAVKDPDEILEGKIIRETEKAILLKNSEFECWLPKSQIKIKKKGENISASIPKWLFDKVEEIDS